MREIVRIDKGYRRIQPQEKSAAEACSSGRLLPLENQPPDEDAGSSAGRKPMVVRISDEIMQEVIDLVPARPFNTNDFIKIFTIEQPELWAQAVKAYGAGGKGAGRHYSAFSYISQTLNRMARRGLLEKLDEYRAIPDGLNWGSPVIRYWTDGKPSTEQLYPDTAVGEGDPEFWEGARQIAFVNRYERSPSARRKCLEEHGSRCAACDLDFGKRYGARGEGFIHVHHIVPVHEAKGPYKIDPVADLVPVCPNCHAMLHRTTATMTIDGLREILSSQASGLAP